METKANYVAVGGFVIVCILGLVVTLLWFAGAQYTRFDYYQTIFKGAVTGLGKGTVVRYNGIEVGRIDSMNFDPNDPQAVVVVLQVQPGLNLREDSVASIESQGLTGGSYIEIDGGKAASPLLVVQPGERYPTIKNKVSGLQELEQSAPRLLAKLNVAADRLNDVLNDQNRSAISGILSNLNVTTATLAKRSGDIDATLRNISAMSANMSAKLPPLMDDADKDLGKFGKLSDDADAFIRSPGLADISDITSDMKKLLASLTRLSDQLDREPTKLLFGDRRKGYSPNGK